MMLSSTPSHAPCTPENHKQNSNIGKLPEDNQQECQCLLRSIAPLRRVNVDHNDANDDENITKYNQRHDGEGKTFQDRAFRVLSEVVNFV